MPIQIAWFRRNLRLADNAALLAAVRAGGSIIPVYIRDELDSGGASNWWLHHSLDALGTSIAAQGGKLVIASGAPVDVLARLVAEHDAEGVYATRRFEPQARRQESDVRDAIAGIADFDISDDSLLYRPEDVTTKTGSAYKVFTPFYNASRALGEPAPPAAEPGEIEWFNGPVDSLELDDLEFLPTAPDWAAGLRNTWTAGEDAAHERLASMASKIKGYAEGRDFPAEDATSRLSPHLHFGEISPRQVWHGIMNSAREHHVEQSAEPLLRQLSWRDFSANMLFHNPTLPTDPLRGEFSEFPWTENEEWLTAWQQGRTGYPIVDAGMRQLWQTGWMHNRVRMIAGSLLVKHLLIPWQHGAEWFADTLVDADTANNSAGWQWVAGSGSDAAPYFRIFNPIAQGHKFDPDGDYVRRWVPELKDLPKQFIHEPWTADSFTQQTSGVTIGKDYPYPIIGHKAGREQALAAYQAMRAHNAA